MSNCISVFKMTNSPTAKQLQQAHTEIHFMKMALMISALFAPRRNIVTIGFRSLTGKLNLRGWNNDNWGK